MSEWVGLNELCLGLDDGGTVNGTTTFNGVVTTNNYVHLDGTTTGKTVATTTNDNQLATTAYVNNVINQKSGITAYQSAATTMSTSFAKFNLGATAAKYGSDLSLRDNAIYCSKDGTVRISGQIYLSSTVTAGDLIYIQAMKNSSSTWGGTTITYSAVRVGTTGGAETVYIPSFLTNVTAGQYIIVGGKNATSARGTTSGNASTFLTVEYI